MLNLRPSLDWHISSRVYLSHTSPLTPTPMSATYIVTNGSAYLNVDKELVSDASIRDYEPLLMGRESAEEWAECLNDEYPFAGYFVLEA